MSRLSKTIREQMARRVVRHRYKTEGDRLAAESVALFNAVIDDQYDAETQKLMDKLARKHKDAFSKTQSELINVRGLRVHVGTQRLGDHECWFDAKAGPRPILAAHRYGEFSSYLDGPLADRLYEFAEAVRKFQVETKSAYAKVLGTLGQFASGKRLAEDWPEVLPLVSDLIPEDSRTLPVVQLAKINAEFELPPVEKLAA